MWTVRMEHKGANLPEPNHFILLVPRRWSTGIPLLQSDDVINSSPSVDQLSNPPPDRDEPIAVEALVVIGYRVVTSGTKRDKPLLIDPENFRYHVDKRRGDRTYWRCCSRSKTACGATVTQVGDTYMPGRHRHLETPVSGSFEAATIRSNVITNCLSDIFRSANEIVDDAMHDVLDEQYKGPCESIANPSHLARYGNRARQRLRPHDPTSLDFKFDYDFEGHGFLKADVHRKSERHLVFATDEGLLLLVKAKTAHGWNS